MGKELEKALRKMEKSAEIILHDILNGTDTRYETDYDRKVHDDTECEDDSDIYTVKLEDSQNAN